MIVRLNGQYWFDTENDNQIESDDILIMKKSNNLKSFAISLWTTSGILFTRSIAHADSFYKTMEPLSWTFQDIALGLGILFGVIGFILLGVKKRWGVVTLKTTAYVVGGVFLVPSLLMLVGIVGTLLNDAFMEAFENIRGSGNIKDVMGR